jgi:hypothetical protein
MYITPTSFWYHCFAFSLRLKNLRVVAGVCSLAGEDGGFHHHPHVGSPEPLDDVQML